MKRIVLLAVLLLPCQAFAQAVTVDDLMEAKSKIEQQAAGAAVSDAASEEVAAITCRLSTDGSGEGRVGSTEIDQAVVSVKRSDSSFAALLSAVKSAAGEMAQKAEAKLDDLGISRK